MEYCPFCKADLPPNKKLINKLKELEIKIKRLKTKIKK